MLKGETLQEENISWDQALAQSSSGGTSAQNKQMHFPSRKTGWKSREIMDSLLQEHSLAKRQWNLVMAVIKQSLVLHKGLEIQGNIPQRERVSLAKGMLAFGRRFGQDRTPRVPSNEGIFVGENRLEANQSLHCFSLAIPSREQQFQY